VIDLLVEVPLDLSHLAYRCKGTSDVVILDFAAREIVSIDLKWGKGVRVFAHDNPQPMAYASGALRQFQMVEDFERVRCVIVQPRIGSVTEEVYTIAEIEEFEERVRAAWDAALEPDAPRIPGEKQCKFCLAKADCPAIANEVLDLFDERDLSLGALLNKLPMIKDWVSGIEDQAKATLVAGGEVEGWKLVAGRKGNRAWKSDALDTLLKKVPDSVLFERAIRSPAKVQKDLGKEQWAEVSDLVTQADGQPVVVQASDPRPEWTGAAKLEDFQEEK